MPSPLDAPRWAPSPERVLRLAVVAFCAGAVVPALTCFPLSHMVFDGNPFAIWLTLLSTVFFAYGVVRLARPFARVSRAAVAFGLSLVGGVLNGATAGFLSGLIASPGDDPLGLSIWGGAFGLVFGLLFGVANALLVQIAVRGGRSPSTMSAGRTAVRLAATVSALVAVALAISAAGREGMFGGMMHDVVAPSRRSLALAFVVPVAITLLAATLAVTSARAQSLRRRWLARVTRGEDSRYRVLPCDAAAAATPLALFDGPGEDQRGDIIFRVDVVDEVDGGAYRHAEHLTAVARLSR